MGYSINPFTGQLEKTNPVSASVNLDNIPQTVTPTGTTGNQTINKAAFSVNFAAGMISLTINNSFVTANSIIVCTVAFVDTDMTTVAISQTNGSFTIWPNQSPVLETRVNCIVIN